MLQQRKVQPIANTSPTIKSLPRDNPLEILKSMSLREVIKTTIRIIAGVVIVYLMVVLVGIWA